MKTIACAQVGGGECPAKFTAETAEEMKTMLSEHAKEAHAEMMAASTPESMEKWNADFEKVWSETPDEMPTEMPAAEAAPETPAE